MENVWPMFKAETFNFLYEEKFGAGRQFLDFLVHFATNSFLCVSYISMPEI